METKYQVRHAGQIVRDAENLDFALTFAELLSVRVIGRVEVLKILGASSVYYNFVVATFENGKEF